MKWLKSLVWFLLLGSSLAQNHSVTLQWNATSNTSTVEYSIFRKDSSQTTWQWVGTVTLPETTFVDTNVISGHSYIYYITAYDTATGLESQSNTGMVTIP